MPVPFPLKLVYLNLTSSRMERTVYVFIIRSAISVCSTIRGIRKPAAGTVATIDKGFDLNPERDTLFTAVLFGCEFGRNAVHLHVHTDLFHWIPEHFDCVQQIIAGRLYLQQSVRQRNVDLGVH